MADFVKNKKRFIVKFEIVLMENPCYLVNDFINYNGTL
jgi:hypothetical protein